MYIYIHIYVYVFILIYAQKNMIMTFILAYITYMTYIILLRVCKLSLSRVFFFLLAIVFTDMPSSIRPGILCKIKWNHPKAVTNYVLNGI